MLNTEYLFQCKIGFSPIFTLHYVDKPLNLSKSLETLFSLHFLTLRIISLSF